MEAIPIPGFCEPFSSISHLFATLLAIVGGYFLLNKGNGNRTRIFSLSVFTFALVFQFSMSGVYHLLDHETTGRAVLQRIDHSAIWFLIAGTFTPIHSLLFRGAWRWGFLSIIWTISITGLVLEVIFFHSIPSWMSLIFYLSLGWFGAFTGMKYIKDYGFEEAKPLIKGGVAYSIGGILEYTQWPIIWPGVIGPHEVFHVFVVLGAFFHWKLIYNRAGYPVITELIINVIEKTGKGFFAYVKGEKMKVQASTLDELKSKLSKEIEAHFPVHVRPSHATLRLKKQDEINL